jgi:hypothetical protein
MRLREQIKIRGVLIACALIGLTTSLASAAAPFVEPEVIALHSFNGEQVGDSFGWEAANLGDINGDKVNDFITSAPLNSENGPAAGKAYIYSGRDGALLHSVVGDARDRFGYSVSAAGDVNRDKVPDYVVGGLGGPRSSPPYKGHVVVYSGKDHSVIHELVATPGIGAGADIGAAGDVNRDGYADLIVGATPDPSFGVLQPGRVYVFSGRDGSVIWSHDGHTPASLLGSAVGRVGDIDRDHIPDLVAGAPGAGPNGAGEVYVFSGKDGHIIYTLTPIDQAGGGSFGWFFASGAGDVNRDRVPDIFVGDWNATVAGNPSTGRAYVFSGKNGSRLYVLDAEQPGDGFGVGRAIGDVNHDKYDDLIIAAYTSSAGAPSAGRAYIYSGRDGRVLRTITGSVAGDSLGVDALSVGDVNGDRLPDYLLTAVGNSFAGVDVGHVYIVAGARFAKKDKD